MARPRANWPYAKPPTTLSRLLRKFVKPYFAPWNLAAVVDAHRYGWAIRHLPGYPNAL